MTPHRRPHSFVRRGLLAAAALVAFAIACNAPVPTSPHEAYSLSVPLKATMAARMVPDDSVTYFIDAVVASKLQAESLRVYDVPRSMLLKTRSRDAIRKQIELWVTSDKASQGAAFGHIRGRPMFANDRADALREKIQLDSATAGMVYMKRPMIYKVDAKTP